MSCLHEVRQFEIVYNFTVATDHASLLSSEVHASVCRLTVLLPLRAHQALRSNLQEDIGLTERIYTL